VLGYSLTMFMSQCAKIRQRFVTNYGIVYIKRFPVFLHFKVFL